MKVISILTQEAKEFQKEVMSYPDCDRLLDCVNCGSCTAACSSKDFMQYGPRAMIRAIVQGDLEVAKSSQDPWICVECFMCEIKCPKMVRPVHIMRALREIQFKNSEYCPDRVEKAKKLQRIFVDQLANNGRLSEFHAALDYKGLLGSLKEVSTGLDLIRTGRIRLRTLMKTGLTFTLAGSSYKIENKKFRDQMKHLMNKFYTVDLT